MLFLCKRPHILTRTIFCRLQIYKYKIHMEAQAVIARIQPVTLVLPVSPANRAGAGAEPMPGFVVLGG